MGGQSIHQRRLLRYARVSERPIFIGARLCSHTAIAMSLSSLVQPKLERENLRSHGVASILLAIIIPINRQALI